MGLDDDADCEHVWRLTGVTLDEGATVDYVCVRCGGLLLVGPGGSHPPTV